MGLISVNEMIRIIKKYFVRIVAVSLAVGLIGGFIVNRGQTYTCTLGLKYNHEGAQEGLAPDGVSKLDPYELQNPVVIQGALEKMGLSDDKDISIKGIRENISINKVITALDKDVSASAALLGEKYDVVTTEYEMTFTYPASLGDEFGSKMFSNIITEYDHFLLDKYYNKKSIVDFAKIVEDTDAEYIVIADTMSDNIDNIIDTLSTLADDYPNYRSVRTGYSFDELCDLYQNLRDIEYAKYYGNIRSGNLARDREMVIKSYQAKVKDLTETMNVNSEIAENYKSEIITFYNPYKAAGLYRQADLVRGDALATNNHDQDVLDDYDVSKDPNTYDNIILEYTDNAGKTTDAQRTIDYYNTIINDYANDNVSNETKMRMLEENESIMNELSALSKQYSENANITIDELYSNKVNDDLQYLILPEVAPDRSVRVIALFLIILTFGAALVGIFVWVMVKSILDANRDAAPSTEKKIEIDTSDMDDTHKLLYEQYLKDFDEFYLVYQSMISNTEDGEPHEEVFIRWNSPQLGIVSPGKIIDCLSDFGIFNQFNDWLVKKVCENLEKAEAAGKELPVVHINCPYKQINDFALDDIIIRNVSRSGIKADRLCFELSGNDIAESLEDIMLLTKIGVNICIDNFEDSDEENEIISVVKPGYIKLSLDILNSDVYATNDDDEIESMNEMNGYFSSVISKCRKNKVKVCICGIENKSQDKMVSQLGFDYKQGYFYGKPEPLEL